MSFTFKWPKFSDDFHRDARQMLEAALNKGNKPPIIADKIEVVELEMGTQPPELEIRDIGDLTLDQFRGIFRLSYAGDAHIVLRTKVQANPLNHKRPDIHMLGGSRGMLAAHQPLVVPMLLRLSHFKLNAYVVLVVSKQKGITLVFKTDPLQNVDVNSTFDSIAVIQKYIQREIEGQLREMFRDDLPSIIHRLSQRWVAGKTKVETPYLSRQQQQPLRPGPDSMTPDILAANPYHPTSVVGLHPAFRHRSLSRMPSLQRMQSAPGLRSTASVSSSSAHSALSSPIVTIPTPSHDPPTTFPDIENFDPTYGLRPDDLPAKSGYSGFGRLFGAPKGLGDLAEEATEEGTDWDEADSFDMVDWEETVNFSPPPSVVPEDATEYETLPAVGGGTITRPRIYHSQSMIRPPTESGSSSAATIRTRRASPTPPHPASGFATPSHHRLHGEPMTGVSTPANFQNPYFPAWPTSAHAQRELPSWISQPDSLDGRVRLPRPASYGGVPSSRVLPTGFPHRSLSPDSSFLTSSSERTRSHPSQSSSAQTGAPSTPPPSEVPLQHSPARFKAPLSHGRQRSLSSSSFPQSEGAYGSSPPNFRSAMDADGNIVLRPGLNNTISQLSTLSHSNHTLSPYTRSLEHFTVRSVPHRASGPVSAAERQPVKAKRKRTYRIGGRKPPDVVPDIVERSRSSSPLPPSEFEASDVEHYFHVPPPSLRRRASYQEL